MLRRLLTLMAKASGPATDADAQAWADAVTAAGGTYSAATLAAVSGFCVAAKANSYWTKLNRINLFCGNQLAAALVPLKVGGGNATDTNMNFVAGDYAEATGLVGNGSSKYLKTGLIPNTSLTLHDTHLAVYNRSSTAASGGVHIGAQSATDEFRTHAPYSDGKVYDDQYNGASGRANTAGTISTPFGFLVGSRTSSSAHVVYRNASSIASNSTSTSLGTLPPTEFYVFATNANGTPGTYTSHPLAGYSIGGGLSSTEVANYYTDLQTFQTALGRSV